mmetsp:Transcript_18311/g.23043  ORF Transcript_18311/g.23043 Transcript_18311/m.23043 type:complete len:103 (-) Transcript_18311:748-1056(-)|eukprot:CAMPEP_0203660806 /NCGR_PEP_ID=MMETSP0088-20131115/58000_1 /ASSEMBLY_ACC=CAM_ASM_001087 /TAXON_ID=426623 /ORGANISM="Chaetoceros affinis, Strain CCMP159" /LENGTH=102 /DNA_ID=CAMNT_0050523313 /DNA_START=367 /DNA_END=675 /DNA_ORIENTATION=+
MRLLCLLSNSCSIPTLLRKKYSLVIVFVYKLIVHNFGGATDTGVQKVMIFMDVGFMAASVSSSFGDIFSNAGAASEYTGTEMGGGGGMDCDAKAITGALSLS